MQKRAMYIDSLVIWNVTDIIIDTNEKSIFIGCTSDMDINQMFMVVAYKYSNHIHIGTLNDYMERTGPKVPIVSNGKLNKEFLENGDLDGIKIV